jgi:UDP-2,4-diacetamido-2,4,6-trideoxy-beta-L-altropyranose hydrolase
MKIAIRADASIAIGSGHIMRCLALADGLREQGASIAFITRTATGPLAARILEQGHALMLLPETNAARSEAEEAVTRHAGWLPVHWRADAQQSLDCLEKLGKVDWLIVDHYALDARWETQMRGVADKIMVIDDLADRPHDCDVLLDQNLQSQRGRYSGCIPDACSSLLGPAFALLRPEFSRLRNQPQQAQANMPRLLVFMGGSDANNYTRHVLDALALAPMDNLAVDIVLGAMNPHIELVQAQCAKMPNCRLHIQTQNMAALMAQADWMLGGAGGATWERCCLGLPALLVGIASNQQQVALEMARRRAALYLGESGKISTESLAAMLAKIIRRDRLRQALSRRARSIVDGLGVQRAIAVLEGFHTNSPEFLLLRQAVEGDCDFIYEVRNHPLVYAHCFSAQPIAWELHCAWFSHKLSASDCRILIIEDSRGKAGVIRFDLQARRSEISISLHPSRLGLGFGAAALELGSAWLRRKLPDITEITARIKPDNIASIKAFVRAGFAECYRAYSLDLSVDTQQSIP